MNITEPLLPAKVGYVEDVNESGEHVYKPIADDAAFSVQQLSNQIRAQSDRTDFIEDCIAELAIQAYK